MGGLRILHGLVRKCNVCLEFCAIIMQNSGVTSSWKNIVGKIQNRYSRTLYKPIIKEGNRHI